MTLPDHVTDTDFEFSLLHALLAKRGRAVTRGSTLDSQAAAVAVLSRAHVAGFDAVVLEARDAGALARWLGQHGFDARPEIATWAAPYVDAGWKITAFTYNPTPGERATIVSTPAVRLSFATDRPVFPYRVPQDNRGGGHLLRLYYVDHARATAWLGGRPWQAKTAFARDLGDRVAGALAGAVPSAARLDAARWLTVFEDPTWPSGEQDLTR